MLFAQYVSCRTFQFHINQCGMLKYCVNSESEVTNYIFSLEGRAYLGSYPELVSALQKTLTSDERDPITRENALGTLQKLSLK